MAGLKDWFIPQEHRFFDLLNAQTEKVEEGARALKEFMDGWGNVEAHRKLVKDIEHEGDLRTHALFEALNASFITPLDREDLAALASSLDNILDYTYAVANRIHLYEIKTSTPAMKELADILHQQTVLVNEVLTKLETLEDRKLIADDLKEIHRLENRADEITNEAIAKLFQESDVKHILKMKEIYEYLEGATDMCEDAADVVRDVLVKHA